jgi:hypothetical protein
VALAVVEIPLIRDDEQDGQRIGRQVQAVFEGVQGRAEGRVHGFLRGFVRGGFVAVGEEMAARAGVLHGFAIFFRRVFETMAP